MKRRAIFVFLFLCGSLLPVTAQTGNPPIDKAPPAKMLTVYAAPLANKNHCIDSVDLSSLMPPVGNQGVQNSCSAWAVGYACRSYYNNNGTPGFFNSAPPDSNTKIVSPTFIYNSLNHGRWDSLVLVSNALKLMVNTGSCSYASMPYSVGCNVKPSEQQKREAENYKIETFGWLNKAAIIDEIKAQLINKQPVVIGALYGKQYFAAGKAAPDTGRYIWRTTDTTKAGHAVVIVGFDDRIGAFKFMNSMSDKWGNKGFGWLSYDIAPKVIASAYVIKPVKTLKPVGEKPAAVKAAERKKEIVAAAQRRLDELQKKKEVLEQEEQRKKNAAIEQEALIKQSREEQKENEIKAAEAEKATAEPEPELSWWQRQVKKYNDWRTASKEKKVEKRIEKVEEKIAAKTDTAAAGNKRANRFDVKIKPAAQPDSTQLAFDLQMELNDCACDSYQIAVHLYWGDVPDRNKKGAPVLTYNPEYSLANGQAAIILDKKAFTGKASQSVRISIPLNQMAIAAGTKSSRGYIKALNRLLAEPVWYNDGFSIKSFGTTPVDVYY